MESASPIRPRTTAERHALLSGFAMAVELVQTHGLAFAVAQLELLSSVEDRIAEREREREGGDPLANEHGADVSSAATADQGND